MKVFISMPMKSKSTEQVKAEMSEVFEHIKSTLPDAELLDSVIDGADKDIAIKGDSIGMWYLGKSILILSEADLVFFVNDWADHRGCAVERKIAEDYGKLCIEILTNFPK